MTYWNAVLLGLVQGVAEFLPISSSGHLAVLQNFLAIGDMENHMLFDVLLHLGTLAAVILAFWKDVREVVTEFARMLHIRRTPRGLRPNRRERRLISFLIIATLPLIPAAFLSKVVESLYQNTFFIGFAFILTGFLLFAADRMGHGNKDERSSTTADALVVGLAQAVAVVPGLSRSQIWCRSSRCSRRVWSGAMCRCIWSVWPARLCRATLLSIFCGWSSSAENLAAFAIIAGARGL